MSSTSGTPSSAPGPSYNVYCTVMPGTSIVTMRGRPTPVVVDNVTGQIVDEVRVPPEIMPSVTGGTLNIHVIQGGHTPPMAGAPLGAMGTPPMYLMNPPHVSPRTHAPGSVPPTWYTMEPQQRPPVPSVMSSPGFMPGMFPMMPIGTPIHPRLPTMSPLASAARMESMPAASVSSRTSSVETPPSSTSQPPSRGSPTAIRVSTPPAPRNKVAGPKISPAFEAVATASITPGREIAPIVAHSPATRLEPDSVPTTTATAPIQAEATPAISHAQTADTVPLESSTAKESDKTVTVEAKPSITHAGIARCLTLSLDASGHVSSSVETFTPCVLRYYGQQKGASGTTSAGSTAASTKKANKRDKAAPARRNPWDQVDTSLWSVMYKEVVVATVGAQTYSLSIGPMLRGHHYTVGLFVLKLPSASDTSPPEPMLLEQTAIKLEASAPSAPAAPLCTKSGRTALRLKWSNPTDDGGFNVTDYELQCSGLEFADNDDSKNDVTISQGGLRYSWENVYEGPEKAFEHKKLRPGKTFAFRVRAKNALGWSIFSPVSLVRTDASVPAAPETPVVESLSADAVRVSWSAEADDNGAEVLEYVLEQAEDSAPADEVDTFKARRNLVFSVIARTSVTYAVINRLASERAYAFRVMAVNKVGTSLPSPISCGVTLPSLPAVPSAVRVVQTSTSTADPDQRTVSVCWDHITASGRASRDVCFHVELSIINGDAFSAATFASVRTVVFEQDVWNAHTCVLPEQLQPGRAYYIRVSASNAVGSSDFSPPFQFTTSAALPAPPTALSVDISNVDKSSWVQVASLSCSFTPGDCNGAAITAYEIQIRHVGPAISSVALQDILSATATRPSAEVKSSIDASFRAPPCHPQVVTQPVVLLCEPSTEALNELKPQQQHVIEDTVPSESTVESDWLGKAVLAQHSDGAWYMGVITLHSQSDSMINVHLEELNIDITTSLQNTRAVPHSNETVIFMEGGLSVLPAATSSTVSIGNVRQLKQSEAVVNIKGEEIAVAYGSIITKADLEQIITAEGVVAPQARELLATLQLAESRAGVQSRAWKDVVRTTAIAPVKRAAPAKRGTTAVEDHPLKPIPSLSGEGSHSEMVPSAAPVSVDTEHETLAEVEGIHLGSLHRLSSEHWLSEVVSADAIRQTGDASRMAVELQEVCLPGHAYQVRFRAMNFVGWSPLTEAFDVDLPAGRPIIKPHLRGLRPSNFSSSQAGELSLAPQELGLSVPDGAAVLVFGAASADVDKCLKVLLQSAEMEIAAPASTSVHTPDVNEVLDAWASSKVPDAAMISRNHKVKRPVSSVEYAIPAVLQKHNRDKISAEWPEAANFTELYALVIRDITPGCAHTMRMAFVSEEGVGAFSDFAVVRASAKPPLAPQAVVATPVAIHNTAGLAALSTSFDAESLAKVFRSSYRSSAAVKDAMLLHWTPSADDYNCAVKSYEVIVTVERGNPKSAEGDTATLLGVESPVLHAESKGATNSTQYKFTTQQHAAVLSALPAMTKVSARVRCISSAGVGPLSKSAEFITLPDVPAAPPALLTLEVAPNSLRLLGTHPVESSSAPPVLGYELQRVLLLSAASETLTGDAHDNDSRDATYTAILSQTNITPERSVMFVESTTSTCSRTQYDNYATRLADGATPFAALKIPANIGFKQSKLKPDALYAFRYAASNIAGAGEWSPWVYYRTKPAVVEAASSASPRPTPESSSKGQKQHADNSKDARKSHLKSAGAVTTPKHKSAITAHTDAAMQNDTSSASKSAHSTTAGLMGSDDNDNINDVGEEEDDATTPIDPKDILNHRRKLKLARMSLGDRLRHKWHKLDVQTKTIIVSAIMIAIVATLLLT